MKTSISEQQELLLLKACQNGGQFSMGLAEQLYSSKQSAQSAVQKLEVLGFIENSAPGYFKVVKVTQDIEAYFEEEQGSEDTGSEPESKETGYSIEAV